MLNAAHKAELHPTGGHAIDQIAIAIRALLNPPSSLYFACNRDRQEAKTKRLSSLESALAETHQRGFAAAVALRSLQPPAPPILPAYTEIIATSGGSAT